MEYKYNNSLLHDVMCQMESNFEIFFADPEIIKNSNKYQFLKRLYTNLVSIFHHKFYPFDNPEKLAMEYINFADVNINDTIPQNDVIQAADHYANVIKRYIEFCDNNPDFRWLRRQILKIELNI